MCVFLGAGIDNAEVKLALFWGSNGHFQHHVLVLDYRLEVEMHLSYKAWDLWRWCSSPFSSPR